MLKISREVRKGSQPNLHGQGSDVRVTDRPDSNFLDKKIETCLQWDWDSQLCFQKASNEFFAPSSPRGSANYFGFQPSRSVEHKPGQNWEPKSSVFPRSSYFLLHPWGPFETQCTFSNHTLHHHWVWEGSFLYWKRKSTILGLFTWK